MKQKRLVYYLCLYTGLCILLFLFGPGCPISAQDTEPSELQSNPLMWVILPQTLLLILLVAYARHCRHTQYRLQESLSTYQTLLHHCPQRMFYKRQNLVYELCNEQYARAIGLAPQDIREKTDHDIYPPEQAERYRAEDIDVLTSGVARQFEETHILNGEEKFLQTLKIPVRDAEGNIIGILGISHDITEYKQTTKVVQQKDQWFATTLKSIGDAVITTDNGGKVTFMNPVAEFLTGWELYEALGKDIGFEVQPDSRKESGAARDAQAEIVLNVDEDTYLIARDGTAIPVEYSGAPIKDERGNITGVVLVLKNITERKLAEESLRKAHEELEQRVKERTAELARATEELRILGKAVETLQIGVTIADVAGRILYTNPADAAMHGYTVEELLGQHVQIFAPPELRQQMTLEQIERLKGWVRESFNIGKDARMFPVHLTSSLVRDEAGNPLAIVTTCEDITERKATENALAEERNLLRTLIDSIPDYVYVKDAEHRFMLVNRACINAQMDTPEAFIGKTDFDLLPREHAERFYADEQAVISSGHPIIDKEERDVDPETGMLRWLSTTRIPLRSSQGEIIGLVGISRDITEHKRTDAKIEHINAVLRAIQDVNQIIVRAKNRQHLIQNVCNRLIETRGFQAAFIFLMEESGQLTDAAESGFGQHFSLLHERMEEGDAPVCVQQALQQPEALIVREGSVTCADCPLAEPYAHHQKMLVRLEHDGTLYGILATIFPQKTIAYDEDKTLLEDVASDIAFALYSIETAENREQAEADLEQERKRLLELLENLPVYVYLQAPDYSIRFANRYFRAQFGEPERGYCYKLLWGRGELWEESPTYQVFYTQEPQEWEWNHYPTGKIYQVYDYPFMDFDGSPLVLELGIDITDRKQMELALKEERSLLANKVEERTAELSTTNQRLQQEIEERKQIQIELQHSKEAALQAKNVAEAAQRASEAANQAKSEFLANMSHELRTPLNAVLGYAQILKTAKNLTERQIEGLETISNSGQHLLNLINEILDLSKIEAGRMELTPNEFHFPQFLRQIAEMIRIRAEQKGLAFVYEPDSELPEGVRADEKKLRQVLLNLLGNAVKFTEKGEVRLKIEGLTPVSGQASILQFSISDTGAGIAQERLEEIFLPFQQVGETRYSVEGTGLGLAISQKLVRLMGGELLVRSTPGQGSVFWFELELPEVSGVRPHIQPVERQIIGYKGKERTILIADDQRENRTLLVNALLPLGFKILEAENGHECVEKVHSFHPDAVLLDLRMPLMDGFEAARHIRKLDSRQSAVSSQQSAVGSPQKAEGRRQKAEGRRRPAPSTQHPEPSTQHPVIIAISASVYEEIRRKSLKAGCNVFLTKPIRLDELLATLHNLLSLEWLYEEAGEYEQPPVSSEILLSENQIQTIIELASKGRAKKLLRYLANLEQSQQELQPILEEFRELVKRFQFQDIIDRLQQ